MLDLIGNGVADRVRSEYLEMNLSIREGRGQLTTGAPVADHSCDLVWNMSVISVNLFLQIYNDDRCHTPYGGKTSSCQWCPRRRLNARQTNERIERI